MAREELASHDIASTHGHRECFGSIKFITHLIAMCTKGSEVGLDNAFNSLASRLFPKQTRTPLHFPTPSPTSPSVSLW